MRSYRSLVVALLGTTIVDVVPSAARDLQSSWRYAPRTSGIPVADSAGTEMPFPFLGGFDVPRPQLVDINGDGAVDLFVQERQDQLMYFERVGARWVWRSDRFLDLDIGEWYRFVDADRDGRVDLFTEMKTGYIRIWRNEGTKQAPKFVAWGDTIRDMDGQAIVADRQNILNAVDIDCNGKLDLMVGRVQGTVDRFEQDGFSSDGSPRFRLMQEMWQGIEVLGPEATGGDLRRTIDTTAASRPDERSDEGPTVTGELQVPRFARDESRFHGANTMAFADVDGKGTLDLFWGDFFEEGLLRFENTGSCAEPNLTGKPARFPAKKPVLTSGYNASTFGDVDGDGNVDMVMGVIGGAYGPFRTSIENLYLTMQSPKGMWTTTTTRLIPTIDAGSESAPTLADVTGDGLLDLIIGSKMAPNNQNSGTVTWFENVGSASAPAFRERGVLPIVGQFNYAPSAGDLDGDGLVDLLLGTWSDRLQWYRNTGTKSAPRWVLADSAIVTITRGTNTTPALGDLDGDGLLDLVVGEASGTLNLYRNAGSKTAPRFELVSDNFQAIKSVRRTAPALIDMDRDGKLDLLLGNGEGDIALWRGVAGSAISFQRDSSFLVRSYPDAVPAAGTLRAGHVDLLVGGLAGGIRWFINDAR